MGEGLVAYAKHVADWDFLDKRIEDELRRFSDEELLERAAWLEKNGGHLGTAVADLLTCVYMREWSRRQMSCKACTLRGPLVEGVCQDCMESGDQDASFESP